ncbi:hypothetical protein AX17_000207 [Amanita inopinata Kibby_2008]|nr:hypothetical protein AX17_000207 [Amanita inopinata Kibby_2008]
MPKVAADNGRRPAASDSRSPQPNVLKRNQACHQCRRRKLKCDAQRPCSTCIRSHNHSIAHAPPGVHLPPKPICTYDEVAEASALAEGPKNKYERLESRINELEALLRQKQEAEASLAPNCPTTLSLDNTVDSASGSQQTPEQPLKSTSNFGPLSSESKTEVFSPPFTQQQLESMHAQSPTPSVTSQSRVANSYILPLTPSIGQSRHPAVPNYGLDVVWSSWPQRLPERPLLLHLVDVFFKFHPHAHRLFHRPNFLTTLSLPPNHPRFPSPAVLHAICATGSLYTAAVTSPPRPTFDEFAPDEIFLERQRLKEQRPDSFAEQQAKYAKEVAEHLNTLGKDLFQVFQANVVLTWFYWSHSRWVDVFFSSAICTRLSVPLGLNMCPPFNSITKTQRPASILPPARTVIEDETRRNAFWLAYATERLHGCGNGWALNLDDQDISQLLPVRGEEFDQGHLVLPQDRQWAHTRDVLLNNPEDITDSFTLYIKGSILISRVKTFNLRFRTRHYAGDMTVSSDYGDSQTALERADPRGSQAFIELDFAIDTFATTFPSRCRNPIMNNIVDSHLYTAWLMPYVASIILHDPHADVQRSGCISALKLLTAARAILDLIYSVCSTSFDITLLDTFCSFCWFSAGRVLVRFLRAAQEVNSDEQVATLQAELEFIHSALVKVGERIPLALRFAKMLDDLMVSRCGQVQKASRQMHFPRSIEMGGPESVYTQTFAIENPVILMEESVSTVPTPTTLSVAVLGPLGTYTHEAAYSTFGPYVKYQEQRTITDIFNVLSALVPIAVVPQENTIFGNVIETYDNLRGSNCGFVRGEVMLKVQHCLLVGKGVLLGDIRRVMSHEQALGQCQAFLRAHLPDAELVKMPSTASAARALHSSPRDCAAICSKICASLFEDLEILHEGIQSECVNYTRFFILAKDRGVKIAPMFTKATCHRALVRLNTESPADNGAQGIKLNQLLKILDSRMNIMRIDRRPNLEAAPFRDIYFVEVKRAEPNALSPCCSHAWTTEVDQTVAFIKQAGGGVDTIGIW